MRLYTYLPSGSLSNWSTDTSIDLAEAKVSAKRSRRPSGTTNDGMRHGWGDGWGAAWVDGHGVSDEVVVARQQSA